MYDVIIIGCGVNGAFIARELAKYELKVLILEKNSDVGDATSCANSGIIHSGYDPEPNTLKAKLNIIGNAMYDEICLELDVEFARIGSLTIAISAEEVEALESLSKRAKENNVQVEMLDKEALIKIEPNITKNVLKALYAPTAGIINPFELVIAATENAVDNGVFLHLNEEVIGIDSNSDGYLVYTAKTSYKARVVVNAAGINADLINNLISQEKLELMPRKGEYYVLDHFVPKYINHVLFTLPTKKGKGILLVPTTSGNYLLGPSSEFVLDKEDVSTSKESLDNVIDKASKLVDFIPRDKIIREFAGLRAYHNSDDFIINDNNGFINVFGIQSPGLSSAPAIALEVIKLINPYFKFTKKNSFNPKRRPIYRLNSLDIASRNELIKIDPRFGNIICRCEQISEGEIVDAINRNCGATSIKGVKKRVRPGAGKCQGGFCEPLVMKILARELNLDIKDISLDNKKSYILLNKTKAGDEFD